MDFTPLNDKEINELNLYPEGRYAFRVIRCEHKRSPKSGNEYFNLKMTINVHGKERTLFDMLFFEGKMIYKTKHFCDVTGLQEQYNNGKLMPYELDGKEGLLDLVQRQNQQTGELQNSVRDYIIEETLENQPSDDFLNDEIPNFM